MVWSAKIPHFPDTNDGPRTREIDAVLPCRMDLASGVAALRWPVDEHALEISAADSADGTRTGQQCVVVVLAPRQSEEITLFLLFSCLVLKAAIKLDDHDVTALLNASAEPREAIGLKQVPHFTSLQKGVQRLLKRLVSEPQLARSVRRSDCAFRFRVQAAIPSFSVDDLRHTSASFESLTQPANSPQPIKPDKSDPFLNTTSRC